MCLTPFMKGVRHIVQVPFFFTTSTAVMTSNLLYLNRGNPQKSQYVPLQIVFFVFFFQILYAQQAHAVLLGHYK